MGFRFRRSIKLAPGIRWNISGSGSSFSFGPRGASVNVGKRGTFLNAGVPGTGLSNRQKIGTAQPATRRTAHSETSTLQMTCCLSDDGTLSFIDDSGSPVSEHLVEIAKKQNREAILGLIQRKCDEINEQIEALGRLHHDTPDCRQPPRHPPQPFDESPPVAPKPRKAGFFGYVFKSLRDKAEQENLDARTEHERALEGWYRRQLAHEQQQTARKRFVEQEILIETGAMERFLEERFQEIVWPRETNVSFELTSDGCHALLDVDLPEIEHMPTRLAAVPARGLRLSVKELSPTRLRKLYMEHVHGILFRLVGETFAALPTVKTVVASGFSQRNNPATGQIQDDYLLSVRIDRERWAEINFGRLEVIDVVEALMQHEIVRKVLRSGALQSISPLST